jgi:hypothetical protein
MLEEGTIILNALGQMLQILIIFSNANPSPHIQCWIVVSILFSRTIVYELEKQRGRGGVVLLFVINNTDVLKPMVSQLLLKMIVTALPDRCCLCHIFN